MRRPREIRNRLNFVTGGIHSKRIRPNRDSPSGGLVSRRDAPF
jgi:hypothetical protein